MNRPHRRRVLVLRPDNLGDVVLFSGAFRVLRALYPTADITVCVRRQVVNLLERCKYIDRLIAWEDLLHTLPPEFQFRGRSRVDQLLTKLRFRLSRSFDVVLVPVRSPTGEMHEVAHAFRSRERMGIAGDPCNKQDGDDILAAGVYTSRMNISYEDRLRPELEVTRDFLRFLGADVALAEVWPEFWTDAADRRWASVHLGAPATGRSVILGIAPGVSSMPQKEYPVGRLVEAVARVTDNHLRVAIFGGAAEVPLCNETAERLSQLGRLESVLNVAGASTIRQLVEGLRQCDLVLAEETAALHIATALRKPTIGIIGGGHFGRFYPWGDPTINRVANRPMDCYGCNWHCRYETVRCVHEIAPEQISKELLALLGTLPATATRESATLVR